MFNPIIFMYSCVKWVAMGITVDGVISLLKDFVHETPMEEMQRFTTESKLDNTHKENFQ